VFAGHNARGALIVAADLALGELVEEPFALVVEGFRGDDLTAEVAEGVEPVTGIERELGVDVFANLLGEGRACSCGRDGDLQVSSADYGREVEVAEGWVVHGVAEDVALAGFVENGAVDGWVVGGGYHEEVVGEVAFFIFALEPFEFAFGGLVLNAVGCGGGDDRDFGVRGAQGVDLRFSKMASADDDAWAGGELEEDWEERHARFLI